MDRPCPSCGYCPACGRSNHHRTFWYYPYHYVPSTPWYVSSGATTSGSRSSVTFTPDLCDHGEKSDS